MAVKLTVSNFTEFKQTVWLKDISVKLKVTGTVYIEEIDRTLYFAVASKQRFLLNEEQQLIGKSCGHCDNYYTVDSFYKDRVSLFEKTTTCKHCRAERDKQFKLDNPKYFSNYWDTEREQITAVRSEWSQKHPDKQYRTAQSRQKALANCFPEDKQYTAEITANQQCIITGVTERLAVDHVLPVTKGRWGNNRGNLMILYEPLNVSKNNRSIFQWSESMTQLRLDYLLPEGIQMTVAEFRNIVKQAVTVKAEEKGLTFEQYKQEYIAEYERKQEEI